MEKFTIRRDIRANGRRWHELIGRDLFSKQSVRDAWKSMENDFCPKTVLDMVYAIDKYSDDLDELLDVRESVDGCVTVAFLNKRCTIYGPVEVEYSDLGPIEPVEIEPS